MRYKEKRICYLVATIEDKKIVPKLQKLVKIVVIRYYVLLFMT